MGAVSVHHRFHVMLQLEHQVHDPRQSPSLLIFIFIIITTTIIIIIDIPGMRRKHSIINGMAQGHQQYGVSSGDADG